MYGYVEYFDLSPEHILQKVTQEQIFEIVFPKVYLGEVIYKSPLRTDRNPRCFFEYHNDVLLFKDFGDKNRTHRSCFRMIMDKYNLTMREALKFICNHFDLSHSSVDYEEVIIEDDTEIVRKTPLHIDFLSKEYTSQDKKYWSQYLIYPDQLLEDGVHSVDKLILNNVAKPVYGLCYAYTFPEDKVKIYRPYAPPKYKWMTNCNNNIVGNIHNISQRGKKLIVAKAYKDSRVIRNLGIKDVIWFQNEGQVPNDMINIDLITRYEEIVFLYDNDEPGIAAGQKLADIYNGYRNGCAKGIYLPKECGYKDPSDFICKEGKQDLINVFKELELYGNP